MIKYLWIVLACSCVCLSAQESDSLKPADISRIMHQILSQHLGKKEVTSKVLQSSLDRYISQFDPNRIYLLQKEVVPFTYLTPDQLSELSASYQKGDFSLFNKLNQVIQKAIQRSRLLRKQMEEERQEALFTPPAAPLDSSSFPTDETELKQKIFTQMALWVQQRAPDGKVLNKGKRSEILAQYETFLQANENQYLYQTAEGVPLGKTEQDNLFSIHILKALASSLDAHTSFYQANEAYDIRLRLQKQFEGIGLGLKEKPDGIQISRLIEGGPAEKTGVVQPGDFVVEINRVPISGLTFSKVMEMLHDEKYPEVSLKLRRPKNEREAEKIYTATIKREEITLRQGRVEVNSQAFGKGIIGEITLHAFYQGDEVSSEKDIRNAIEELRKKGNLEGLILDLRDNSGGFLSQAVKVAGLFISNGVIVVSKYANGDERIYRDVDNQTVYDGPLIILTSKITASAAEILALALKDYGVALIVGDEHTYGKGTIQMQTITDSQSSTYFKVTAGTYYGVGGTTPQLEGVKADIVVPGPWSKEPIGEVYADAVIPEEQAIVPEFKDNLKDIPANQKGWYLKYYLPTLQKPSAVWTNLLPILQKNSAYRISHNKDYQFFLTGKIPPEDTANEGEDEAHPDGLKNENFGIKDLQMQEAISILKDMIRLHRRAG